ncbi:MAG TPA: hypothetical protein VNK26_02150 [Pyrinomonadaceae bacterium]|nr:hypothetical protein [Pyrinomonadaceae bacterium]
MPTKYLISLLTIVFLSAGIYAVGGLPGAIYTSNFDGSRVNQNIYSDRLSVYLNGGPNNANSRGLLPGYYYFEVTDPSGKTLLSTDPAECRQLVVNADGRIYGVRTDISCSHNVGWVDAANGGLPVQLAPFAATPNPGGEYKVSIIKADAPGVQVEEDGFHIDYPKSAAKSDNFKVKQTVD